MFMNVSIFSASTNCNGYREYSGSNSNRCYYISDSNTKASWTGARQACQQQGGDLAVLETQNIYDEVKILHRSTNKYEGKYLESIEIRSKEKEEVINLDQGFNLNFC